MDISALDAPWFDLETNESSTAGGSKVLWIPMRRDRLRDLRRMEFPSELLCSTSSWDLCCCRERNSRRITKGRTGSRRLTRTVWAKGRYPWNTFLWNPANPDRIDVIEPSQWYRAWGIGDGMFMTYTDASGENGHFIATLYSFAYSEGELQYELLDTIPAGISNVHQ